MSKFVLESKGIQLAIDSHGAWISRVSRPGGGNLLANRAWSTPPKPTPDSSYGSSIADFHASYEAGWHLLFPNAGNSCEVLGTPLPFHGEVANHEWNVLKSGRDFIELETVARLPLEIIRTVQASGDSIRIEDRVKNLAPITVPYIMGHHPVFPLSDILRVDLPVSTPEVLHLSGSAQSTEIVVSNLMLGHLGLESTFNRNAEQQLEGLISLKDLESSWFAARSIRGRTSLGVCWDKKAMPHMWVWVQNRGLEFPWFGRAQFLGLEPQTAPTPDGLNAAIAKKQCLQLTPGESQTSWLELYIFEDSGPVRAVKELEGPLGLSGS